MEGESLRRSRRRQKLEQLLEEIGGATRAEVETGTPRTHFVALVKGRRGLGDDLAAKLERAFGKPPGWFDAPESNAAAWPFSRELHEEVLKLGPAEIPYMEAAMWSQLRKVAPSELHYYSDERTRRNAPAVLDLNEILNPAQGDQRKTS